MNTEGPVHKSDRWFTFLLALIVAALGAIGALQLALNAQTWNKLDRISTLFINEKNEINHKLDNLCEKLYETQGNVKRLESLHMKDNKK